jgi:hypothetical protein
VDFPGGGVLLAAEHFDFGFELADAGLEVGELAGGDLDDLRAFALAVGVFLGEFGLGVFDGGLGGCARRGGGEGEGDD